MGCTDFHSDHPFLHKEQNTIMVLEEAKCMLGRYGKTVREDLTLKVRYYSVWLLKKFAH